MKLIPRKLTFSGYLLCYDRSPLHIPNMTNISSFIVLKTFWGDRGSSVVPDTRSF